MKRSDYQPGGRPFTGRKFLWTILGFFGVVIAANAAMAWFALRDFRGVVVDSGYVASQSFNEDRAALEAQAERGWAWSVEAPGGAPLLSVENADGYPIDRLRIEATALRVADGRADRPLTVSEVAPGLYAADETLAPGRWRIALRAEGGGEPYSAVLDLFVER